jgi:hypothetical protein
VPWGIGSTDKTFWFSKRMSKLIHDFSSSLFYELYELIKKLSSLLQVISKKKHTNIPSRREHTISQDAHKAKEIPSFLFTFFGLIFGHMEHPQPGLNPINKEFLLFLFHTL